MALCVRDPVGLGLFMKCVMMGVGVRVLCLIFKEVGALVNRDTKRRVTMIRY